MQRRADDRAAITEEAWWSEEEWEAGFRGITWVVVRTFSLIGIWLVPFLGMFLGYVTVPLVILIGFILVFTTTDAIISYRTAEMWNMIEVTLP